MKVVSVAGQCYVIALPFQLYKIIGSAFSARGDTFKSHENRVQGCFKQSKLWLRIVCSCQGLWLLGKWNTLIISFIRQSSLPGSLRLDWQLFKALSWDPYMCSFCLAILTEENYQFFFIAIMCSFIQAHRHWGGAGGGGNNLPNLFLEML